jgi:hypothetical protein
MAAKKTKKKAKAAKKPRAHGADALLGQILKRLAHIEACLGSRAAAPAEGPKAFRSEAPCAPEAVKAANEPVDKDTVAFLQRTTLFAKLTPAQCAVLAEHCELKRIESGQILFKEGDFGDALYILKEGSLEIFKRDFLGDVRIAEIKPGGIVGEMALVENKPRSANVRAVDNTVLLVLSRTGYTRLKEVHPAVATKLQDELLLLISSRLRQTTEKLVGQK